jgi:hypothetical protein
MQDPDRFVFIHLTMMKIICILCWIAQATAATVSLSWNRQVGDQGTTTIVVGDTVTWVWTETIAHTVESTGTFASATKNSGSYSYTFTSSGSYSYFCGIHNSMRGTIVVTATNPTAAPTNQPTRAPTASPTTFSPTFKPTTAAPVSVVTAAPTNPTIIPTVAPTPSPSADPTASPSEQPTVAPTIDLAPYLSNLLDYPEVLSSGTSDRHNWNATLYVRQHRVVTSAVSFNTRAYCHEDASADVVCSSLVGPTILLTPGDNFTLTLINELGSAASMGGKNYTSLLLHASAASSYLSLLSN